jgi:hypothetical protein
MSSPLTSLRQRKICYFSQDMKIWSWQCAIGQRLRRSSSNSAMIPYASIRQGAQPVSINHQPSSIPYSPAPSEILPMVVGRSDMESRRRQRAIDAARRRLAVVLVLLSPWFLNLSLAAAPQPSCAEAACTAEGPAVDEDADEELEDIMVTSARPRGAVRTSVPPEIRVERDVIRALGADSLDDVLGAFAPQAQTLRGGGEPVLLVNGRRIASRSEIESIPPEAIRRLEIFPEEVALQFGYPPDRRVVNIILRRSYHALELQANSDLALGGRLNLDVGYRLQESVRDNRAGVGAATRSRLPHTERVTANGTFAHDLSGLLLTANGNGQWREEDWRLGRGTGGRGLERRVEDHSGGASLALNGGSDDWQWSMAGGLSQQQDRIATREGGGLAGAADLSVRGNRRDGNFDLTIAGSPGMVPAGNVEGAVSAGFALRRHDQRDLLTFASPAATKQDSAHVGASLDVPILAARRLAAFVEGRAETSNRHDLLGRYGGGLRGEPMEGLNLSASYSHARDLPAFGDLAGTRVATPNVRTYDFVSGSEAYVLQQEGGNPDLKAAGTETVAMRAQYQPFADRDLSLSVDYSDQRLRNGASGTLGPTPQVETALPGRFTRDGTGALTAFDSTAVNITRQHRRQLRSGINLTSALDDEEPSATPAAGDADQLTALTPDVAGNDPGDPSPPPKLEVNQWQFALYHTWTIGDEARLRPGADVIDLLDGAAIGNRGGTSRHLVEGQFGFVTRRFGLRLAAQWRSRTRVDDLATMSPAGHRLTFSPVVTLDARMYVNLKPAGDALGLPWLKGRLNISVDNVLGTHSRIRDENGDKVSYYRGSEDTAGRTIRLSFRKVIR